MEKSKEISALLSDLLYHYDCVIVPEFGGFVTEYRSARIDKEQHILHPPSKDLRFNAQLKKNDGLLANALSQAASITHEEANSEIKRSVDSYFSELEEGNKVVFDKVGILYLDSQKNVQFRADETVNYLLESFRLKKVYASPIAPSIETPMIEEAVEKELPVIALIPAKKEEKKKILPKPALPLEPVIAKVAPVAEETPVVPIVETHHGRRWLAAALIPLLLYLGFVAVRSDVVSDGKIQMSDLNPFAPIALNNKYVGRTDIPSIELESIEFPQIEDLIVEVPTITTEELESEAETPVEETKAPVTIPSEKVVPTPAVNTYVATKEVATMEFHVIGGCFSEQANAEQLVTRLRKKGYDAHIIDTHKGLHRVAYGSFMQRKDALDALAAVKQEEQSEAWLLRKK